MMGQQCDGPGCQLFAPQPNAGWLVLGVQHPDAVFLATVTHQQPTLVGTFCSMQCVSEFAYAQSVITGPPAGTEPAPAPPGVAPPGTGTGWPG